jgi:beta-lactamase regulating signal transducer with metallopeptidase domain
VTELLLRIGVSNLLISLALGVLAWAVQVYGRRPRIAHFLWLLVLLKLVTPPIVSLPVVAIPETADAPTAPVAELAVPVSPGVSTKAIVPPAPASTTVEFGTRGVALLWLAGSAWILGWSMVRILRFHRLLGVASEEAPRFMQELAKEISGRLGLRSMPAIMTTSARVSPLVWWIGGRTRVLIPAALPREMPEGQFRWVLAHELAHVSRRDHLVRWLEWLACVAFWWNPVAWWARRNLRGNEEICCDALVLESLSPDPRTYGNSLLSAVEFLAAPVLRSPAVASEIDSGGFLERRFKMIVSGRPVRRTPRGMRAILLLLALVVLPLGLAQAKEPDFDAVGKRLRKAVEAEEFPAEQAKAMIRTLKVERYRGMERRLSAAAKDGKMSREEVGQKLGELRKRQFGVDKAGLDRFRKALSDGGVARGQVDHVLGAVLRIVHEMKSEGESFELDARLKKHLVEKMGLTEEQMKLVLGISRRVAAAVKAPYGGEGGERRGR